MKECKADINAMDLQQINKYLLTCACLNKVQWCLYQGMHVFILKRSSTSGDMTCKVIRYLAAPFFHDFRCSVGDLSGLSGIFFVSVGIASQTAAELRNSSTGRNLCQVCAICYIFSTHVKCFRIYFVFKYFSEHLSSSFSRGLKHLRGGLRSYHMQKCQKIWMQDAGYMRD